MKRLVFTEAPPEKWAQWCKDTGGIFNSPRWQVVLEKGFGAATLYGWNEELSTGFTVTVFKAGPFRIGYIGFPAGLTAGRYRLDNEMISLLKVTDYPVKIHLLRIPTTVPEDNVDLDITFEVTLETVIEDLQAWQHEGLSPNLKRSIRRGRSSTVTIVDASEASQGEALYRFYRETILRRGGNLRYTENYFRALIDYSLHNKDLRCILALADEAIAGFLVVACHNETAFDLHCCINMEYKKYAVSDLLTDNSITWARGEGMKRYSFMASPAVQKSLVEYKEKWGGRTQEQQTYELALRPLQSTMFNIAAKLIQKMSGYL